MKVLVTGANGFLGSWVCRRLIQEEHEVSALVRKNSDLSELKGLPLVLVEGDVTEQQGLITAFAGMDSIFHLAGVIGYKPSQRALMQKVNVEGTRNVVQACKSVHVRRLVYLSSVVAVGAGLVPTEILNENSPFNLQAYHFGYFDTKFEAEKIVLGEVLRQGLDAVILNPSTIYGAGDARKASRSMQVKVAQGKMPFYPSGGASVVDIEDVVDGIIAGWKKGRSGERYILSGENLLLKDIFRLIAEAAGQPEPRIKIPDPLLLGLGRIGDLLTKVHVPTSLSYENAKVATLYHWFDCTKARTHLGFNPKPAKIAIEKSVGWMKENGF